jgi:hypothetical protein
VTWLIVVGGVIALALAVRVAEQRRARAIVLARRNRREASSSEPQRFSVSCEVKETWVVDLQTMLLELTRSDDASTATFLLERSGDGAWQMRPSVSPALAVPVPIAEQLEQRFQRVSRSAAQGSG